MALVYVRKSDDGYCRGNAGFATRLSVQLDRYYLFACYRLAYAAGFYSCFPACAKQLRRYHLMSKIIIVKDISKRYQIGGLNPGYATFREFLAGAVTMPIRRLRRTSKSAKEDIWALRDINFEMESGEI